jgi:hypothetical protein
MVIILQWYHALRAQTVIRILNGYVLFDSWEGVGRLGDQIEVQRKTGETSVSTGKVKLLLFKDGMASGKIVAQDEANPVRVGDVVRRSGTVEKSVPKTGEPLQAAKTFSPAATSSATAFNVPGLSGQSMKPEKPILKTAEPVQSAKSASSAVKTSGQPVRARSDSTQTVLRVVPGYVLVDPGKEPWKEDSVLRVMRKMDRGIVDVGDLKVVKRENGKVGAKIVRESEPYKIAPGDSVTAVVQDFDIDSYFFGAFGGR